jgi:hypothetical protein
MNKDCKDNDWAYTDDCSQVNDIQIFKDGPKKLTEPPLEDEIKKKN